MQFRLYFPLLNYIARFTFMGRFLQNFVLFPFLFLHLFIWMNKFLFPENNFLPRLVKKESYRSSHYIYVIVSALNTRSIKTHRRGSKVLIMLLIEQQFDAALCFFTTLYLIWPNFAPKRQHPLSFFVDFQWNMLGDSININNLCCNPVVLK